MYDIWSPYDPSEAESAEEAVRHCERWKQDQQAVRAMLPQLCHVIEDGQRDTDSVFQVLYLYYQVERYLPMTAEDLPELERLCRLILERRGPGQHKIQRVLLRLIGETAAPAAVPFLREMLRYTRRGDSFGPERRQLALWGLARIAAQHNVAEAFEDLSTGLDDRQADVRITAADLVIDAYLTARGTVPQDVVDELRGMVESDPDRDVRRTVRRFLGQGSGTI